LRDLQDKPAITAVNKIDDVCDAYYHSIEKRLIQITFFRLVTVPGGIVGKGAGAIQWKSARGLASFASQGGAAEIQSAPPRQPRLTKRFSKRDSIANVQTRETAIEESLKALDALGSR